MAGDSVNDARKDGATASNSSHESGYLLSNYVMSEQEAARKASQDKDTDAASPAAVAKMFGQSLVYSALQNPLDGATQLVNEAIRPIAGKDLVPRVEVMSAPPPTPQGSAEWTAKLAGGGIGTILPFYFGGKLAVKALEPLAEVKYIGPALQASNILKENSVAQLAFKGAVYEGVMHPVNEGTGLEMLGQRTVNGVSGALSFMAMGQTSKWMTESSWGRSLLESRFKTLGMGADFAMNGVSGAIAGVTDAGVHALASWQAPSWSNLGQNAGEYAVMAMFLKGARIPFEKAANTPVPEMQAEKPAVPKAEAEAHDAPLNLRPTLPFDRIDPLRQKIASTNELADLLGTSKDGKWKLFYRDADPDPAHAAVEPIKMHVDDLTAGKYQTFEHKGQSFVIDQHGAAYAVQYMENGMVQLMPTNKLIIDRINEAQVPWAPVQNDEHYKTRSVIRFSDLWNWSPAPAH